jgi:hypothetical protein
MTHNSGLCTSGQKWIKTRMKTPIPFNSKGNEIIDWCSFIIGSCFLLSNHHRYMWCRCWYLLHHICANWVSNNNVHQNLKTIYGDKDIHSLSNLTREKVVDLLLNVSSTFQSNNCNIILKCVCGFPYIHFQRGTKANEYLYCHWYDHIDTMWTTIGCGKPKWVCNSVRKWVDNKRNVGVVK